MACVNVTILTLPEHPKPQQALAAGEPKSTSSSGFLGQAPTWLASFEVTLGIHRDLRPPLPRRRFGVHAPGKKVRPKVWRRTRSDGVMKQVEWSYQPSSTAPHHRVGYAPALCLRGHEALWDSSKRARARARRTKWQRFGRENCLKSSLLKSPDQSTTGRKKSSSPDDVGKDFGFRQSWTFCLTDSIGAVDFSAVQSHRFSLKNWVVLESYGHFERLKGGVTPK